MKKLRKNPKRGRERRAKNEELEKRRRISGKLQLEKEEI